MPSLDDYFPDWKEREALAEAMIPIIGRLYRNNVVTYCYGRALYNQSVIQIMKTHRYVRQVAQNELSEFESYPALELAKMWEYRKYVLEQIVACGGGNQYEQQAPPDRGR